MKKKYCTPQITIVRIEPDSHLMSISDHGTFGIQTNEQEVGGNQALTIHKGSWENRTAW